MSQVIYWYPLGDGRLPANATVLHIGLRRGVPVAWCRLDPSNITWRTLHTIATGMIIPDGISTNYIGTIQFPDGIVLHYFMGA